jgi:hypothetical protein
MPTIRHVLLLRFAFMLSILLCVLSRPAAWAQGAPQGQDSAEQTRVINSQEITTLYTMCKGADTLYWHPSQQKVLYAATLPFFTPDLAPGSLATLRAKALHVVEDQGLMINSQGQDYLVVCDDPAAPLYNNNVFVGVISPRDSHFSFVTEDNRELSLPILDLCSKAGREKFTTFMLQGGSISIPVPRQVSTQVPCTKCKGSGKLGKDSRQTVTCTTCRGAGQVEGLNNTHKRCAGCGGTGQRSVGEDLRRQCGTCGGHGKYDEVSIVTENVVFRVGEQ